MCVCVHIHVYLFVLAWLVSTPQQVTGESLSNQTGPFVLCAKGEHGGELVLILLWPYRNDTPEPRRAKREVFAQGERQEQCMRESQRKRKEQWEDRRVPNNRRYQKVAKEDNESLRKQEMKLGSGR